MIKSIFEKIQDIQVKGHDPFPEPMIFSSIEVFATYVHSLWCDVHCLTEEELEELRSMELKPYPDDPDSDIPF